MAQLPPRPPRTSSLYHMVQAFAAKKNKEIKMKPPKAKGGGSGGRKAKKFYLGPDIELIDIMNVALEGSVGDSKDQQHAFYQNHLKKLSRKQLDRLMKNINQIASDIMHTTEEETEYQQFKQLRDLASETIEPLLHSSLDHIEVLNTKIQERLQIMDDLTLITDNNQFKLKYLGAEYPTRRFAKIFFKDIVTEYKRLIALGLIIPDSSEKQGSSFVANTIIKLLL